MSCNIGVRPLGDADPKQRVRRPARAVDPGVIARIRPASETCACTVKLALLIERVLAIERLLSIELLLLFEPVCIAKVVIAV
jgi:hypothetical protein